MFEVANIIFPIFLCMFQGYCLQYFYGSFLDGRIKDRRWNSLAVAGSYVVLEKGLALAMLSTGWDDKVTVGKLVLALCILSLLAVCFYKAFHLITIFLVVAFQAVADMIHYATVILLDRPSGRLHDLWIDLWNWCIGHSLITSEKTFGIAINVGLVSQWIFEYLLIMLFMYFSLKRIVKNFREKDYSINRTELLFILTPAAVGLMICMLLRIIMVTVEDSVPQILYDRYPILVMVVPAILLLSLLSILCGVKLLQNMIHWNREKSGRIVLEKQIRSLQEHMEEMERIYSGIRGMKHDMKNTLAVIQRLSAEGDEGSGELQVYLSEMNRSLEKLEVRFKTGNTVVDTLLNMKCHEAVRDVPDLKMDADKLMLPQGLEIHSYDIGVILGNAMDNAIEACRKLKAKEPEADAFIRLCSLQKGNLLILKVENSFDGRLVRRRQEEFPITDKADKSSHGIGLANIKSTAEKYQGTMDFKVNGRVFILSVMMKNESKEILFQK